MIRRVVLLAVMLGMPITGARADTALRVYEAMKIPPQNILTSSIIPSRVMDGEGKQIVAIVTYMTGKRSTSKTINVRMGIYHDAGGKLISIYSRDFGDELGYQVAKGEVLLVDLDSDGNNEIVVTFESLEDPLIQQRWGEVIMYDASSGFESVWSDLMEYDGTKAARKVPEERRDHFVREVSVVETLRTHGRTLFMVKEVLAVAGERLPTPKVVQESYPLRRD